MLRTTACRQRHEHANLDPDRAHLHDISITSSGQDDHRVIGGPTHPFEVHRRVKTAWPRSRRGTTPSGLRHDRGEHLPSRTVSSRTI
jgi:hypothetical protein